MAKRPQISLPELRTQANDSLAFCKKLVHEARIGLAPGAAFGPEGEGYLRWCFASDDARLADGVARFARGLQLR